MRPAPPFARWRSPPGGLRVYRGLSRHPPHPPPAAPLHPPVTVPTPSPYLVVFTLWLLVFSASSQIMIMSPILPQIGDQLGVPDAVLGTLVSAYSFMVGVFAILAGPVSDRVGRRRMLL